MILQALTDWNHWWEAGVVEEALLGQNRPILKQLISTLKLREIKLLIGVRRSGKSTLFYQLISHLLKKGVNPKEILLINFEDDVLSKKSLREIYEEYRANINPKTAPYLFMDEVHRCNEWALFLRKLYDLKKVKQIFITDSSSKYIRPDFARVLTGRSVSIPIFPLSFEEYLHWSGFEAKKSLSSDNISIIRNCFLDFLRWGGFPEVFFKTEAQKKPLLLEYFSDIIHKDIIERYNLNYAKVKHLADILVTNSGKLFSPRKYSRTYGLSLESINTYLHYFGEVFLFFLVPKFSYSLRSQQISPKKVYVVDMGFFNNLGFQFSQNIGRVYENTVFIELRRRGNEVYYWSDAHECDFVVKEGIKVKEVIQVCCELNEENKAREVKGVLEAMEEFKLRRGLVITRDYEKREGVSGKEIVFKPLWKWLLNI
ncbi:ATP-binding protein [Candidatus Woesearchaeota archaeon]|nr:MAG: ATP-binding protein [Candidatus Woesearchaeota archaeon]